MQIVVTALIAVITVAWTTGGTDALRRRTILGDLDIAARIEDDELRKLLLDKAQALAHVYVDPARRQNRLVLLGWRLAFLSMAFLLPAVMLVSYFPDERWTTIAISVFMIPAGITVGLLVVVKRRLRAESN